MRSINTGNDNRGILLIIYPGDNYRDTIYNFCIPIVGKRL